MCGYLSIVDMIPKIFFLASRKKNIIISLIALVCSLPAHPQASQTTTMSVSVGSSGTLSYQYQQQTSFCQGTQTSATYWQNFSFTPTGGSSTSLNGSIWYVYQDPCIPQISGGWDYIGPGSGSANGYSNVVTLSPTLILNDQACTISVTAYEGDAQVNPTISCQTLSTSTFSPLFKIASILYSPPGNQSSQGYGTGSTSGTTSTIGNSFTFAKELTYSVGKKINDIFSIGGSASWGYSVGTGNSSAFTQTWTNATNYVSTVNKSSTYNPTSANGINHHLDLFEIWLNPQVTIQGYESTPVSYSTNSQPITFDGEEAYIADVLPIPAIAMEAQPAGVTALNPSGVAGVSAIPLSDLIPQRKLQEDGTSVYQQGIGAICKNNALYKQQLAADQATSAGQSLPEICTQANQCGCTPADFAVILEQNPLLNYNSSTYTASPGDGTVSPLMENASGDSVCGYDQPAGYVIPSGADCRYVIVPQSGTNIPIIQSLNGAQSSSYSQTDSTVSTYTTTSTHSYNTGLSFSVGFFLSSLKTQETWTWTDTEGTGSSTGGTNTMNVTLQTSNASCSEDVNIYEDTLYHTYVFQAPNNCS